MAVIIKYIYISLKTDDILERYKYYAINQLMRRNSIGTFSLDASPNTNLIPDLHFYIKPIKVGKRRW